MLTSKKQVEIWPLRLIDLDDEEQVQVVYSLLGRLPHVIHYYLSNYIFPEVMRHQGMKLSACGQELGGGIQIFYYLPNRVFFLILQICYFHLPYGFLWNTKRFASYRVRQM